MNAAILRPLLIAVALTLAAGASAEVFEIFPTGETTSCSEEFENVANSLQPGDELILNDGEYWQSCRRGITVQGTEANPIVIRAADGATPILTRPPDDRNDNNIEISGQWFTMRGLVFRGGSVGVRFNGGTHHITFEDNEVFNTSNNAINMNSGDTDSFIIRNNHLHDTGVVGSNTEGEGLYIGCHSGNCVASNHLIENNYIHHLRATSTGGNDGIELKYRSHSNIVRGNLIHDTTIGQAYPCIFSYGGGPAPNIIENNVVYNCGSAILVTADTIVRNNVIMTSNNLGIQARTQNPSPVVQNVSIVNNTIFGTFPTCVQLRWASASNVVFANNAIYCPSSRAVDASGIGNALAKANYVSGSLTGVSIDNDAFFAAPDASSAFEDVASENFRLQTGTALIDAGDGTVPDLPSTDHAGDARVIGGGIDVGAFEFQAGGGAPPVAVNLTASATSIDSGDRVTLTWSAQNAQSCTAGGDWNGTRPVSGSETTAALTANATFSLTCTGAGGSASDSVNVTVSAPLPAPTLTLDALPLQVDEGGNTTLRWTSTDAQSCTASGAWSGSRPTSGDEFVTDLTTTSTFALTCSNASGNATRSVTVTVQLDDSDADGLPDDWEMQYFSDLDEVATDDPDTDGLDNAAELDASTDPTVPDTDQDGLSDGDEGTHQTDPLNADTDGDGATDGDEVAANSDPTDSASTPAPPPNPAPSPEPETSTDSGGSGSTGAFGLAFLLMLATRRYKQGA